MNHRKRETKRTPSHTPLLLGRDLGPGSGYSSRQDSLTHVPWPREPKTWCLCEWSTGKELARHATRQPVTTGFPKGEEGQHGGCCTCVWDSVCIPQRKGRHVTLSCLSRGVDVWLQPQHLCLTFPDSLVHLSLHFNPGSHTLQISYDAHRSVVRGVKHSRVRFVP